MSSTSRDLVEIFGHSPRDNSPEVRKLWEDEICPFVDYPCIKKNHDRTVTYGVCSVTSPSGPTPICPVRFYDNRYATLRRIANEVFGDLPFLLMPEFEQNSSNFDEYVVPLGQRSGREVSIGGMSMDWVLTHWRHGKLLGYVGVEIQSIDITGNYRDAWHGYKNGDSEVPPSGHGMNWANVHKRLIPQLIRKGMLYSRSEIVSNGLFFVLPDSVYQKFEEILGSDIPHQENPGPKNLTVHTYSLSGECSKGERRTLVPTRTLRFALSDFKERFVSGSELPSGAELDEAVSKFFR